MAEPVSSEDPSVRTFRARIERSGATSRPQLTLPPAAAEHVSTGVIRIDLDGTTVHADVREGHDGGGPVIRTAADNARLARSPGEGPNRLRQWLDEIDLDVGRSVLVDVVVPGHHLGARRPGTTTVYEATEPPQSSLSRIADDLDG